MDDKVDILLAASRLKRDASMMLLVNVGQKSIQQLALLTDLEKRAVASIVLVGQLVTVYSRSNEPDRNVMAGFEQMLNSISPAVALHARSLSIHAMPANGNKTQEVLAEVSELTHDIGVLIHSMGKLN